MKIAVDVPDEIFTELKVYSVRKRKKLKEVIVMFLSRGSPVLTFVYSSSQGGRGGESTCGQLSQNLPVNSHYAACL